MIHRLIVISDTRSRRLHWPKHRSLFILSFLRVRRKFVNAWGWPFEQQFVKTWSGGWGGGLDPISIIPAVELIVIYSNVFLVQSNVSPTTLTTCVSHNSEDVVGKSSRTSDSKYGLTACFSCDDGFDRSFQQQTAIVDQNIHTASVCSQDRD